MAITPIYSGSPTFEKATLSETANTLLQVNLPALGPQYVVSLQAQDTDAYMTTTGTDGEDVGDNAKVLLSAGALIQLENTDRSTIFLGSETSLQEVTIILERAW
jgi:hypothetical protein